MPARIDRQSLTPLMQQYHNIKKNYQDAILFFRLGDFYEMFGEDAVKASPALEIVLTKRQDVPMCGVPYHSVANYLAKLIKKGFKVAICEQIEDPSSAKGLVKREVIRLITPGTVIEENLLDTKKNNYLLAVYPEHNGDNSYDIGIAYLDISTGDFFMTELADDNTLIKFACELTRINPSEYLIPPGFENSQVKSYLDKLNIAGTVLEGGAFEYNQSVEKIRATYSVKSMVSFGIKDKTIGINSCGAILSYLEQTQKLSLPPLKTIKYYSIEEYMQLDDSAIRNLELLEGLTTRSKQNSLLEILDHTSTPMGSRFLRKCLLQPLTNKDEISARQSVVEFFVSEGFIRRQLSEIFKMSSDLERILSRLSSGLANPRDLIALRNTLKTVPEIKNVLNGTATLQDMKPKKLNSIIENLYEMEETVNLISKVIADNPPVDVHKTGVIKEGYNKELDELHKISRDSKTYLAQLEQKERARTGINSLKIGYTSTFGYYIEVTKVNLNSVPREYVRRQTLTAGAERFVTEELKQYEEKTLTAEQKIQQLELEIFNQIKQSVLKESDRIHIISFSLAELDMYLSLAKVAVENDYCKPVVDYSYKIDIKDGRHPVIEKKLYGKSFVPNDIYLDGKEHQIIILTGPNMAGKSTYLRQAALIVIMAQIGSFVPARETSIGIIDRIFTRIGSADSLATGESTFMVEMNETAKILHNATQRSLLILDEVGRGTSTFDGISIAWAVVEHLTDKKGEPGPKVLFATHYFELTELGEKYPGIKNFNVSIREWKDEITFLYKIVPGCSDRSYGIHVAKLAGLPQNVINRAREVLLELEKKSSSEFDKLDRLRRPADKLVNSQRSVQIELITNINEGGKNG